MKEIQTVLKTHNQNKSGNYCSASAHEFIAKVHEKIALTDYPLQTKTASDQRGFEFEVFLNSIGLTGHDDCLLPQAAINTFAMENAEQRFPLVSILVDSDTGSIDCHIVVAVPSGTEVALADPAKHDLITNTTAKTLKLLQTILDKVPNRKGIHILTYRAITGSDIHS